MKPIYFLALVSVALLYLWKKGGVSDFLRNLELVLAVFFLLICGVYWVYDRFWGGRRK